MLTTSSGNQKAAQLSQIIALRLLEMRPKKPDLKLYTKLSWKPNQPFYTKFFDFQFDISGAIVYLNQKSPREYLWANASHSLSKFLYQTFTYDDFHTFNSVYNQRCQSYVCSDFGKPSMNSTYNIRADWETVLLAIFEKNYPDRSEYLLELGLDPILSDTFGAPRQIYVTYAFSNTTPQIDINLQWFEKPATRLAEAMWLKFTPIVSKPTLWEMDVMGSPVSPYEVVVNGSRHLHAIWTGVSYREANNSVVFSIESKDANLVAPGDTDHLLFFDGANQPKVEGGMHFNIYNNLWGTAFNQWYDDDARFRFTLHFT